MSKQKPVRVRLNASNLILAPASCHAIGNFDAFQREAAQRKPVDRKQDNLDAAADRRARRALRG